MSKKQTITYEIQIEDLPENLWTNIVSFLRPLPSPIQFFSESNNSQSTTVYKKESKHREEQALRCTCKNFNQLLTSEEHYQIKVMEMIAKGKDVTSWPSEKCVGGWKILHDNIVSLYTPLEGFYFVCNAWPWGLFVQCHFENGKFCGDLIRAVPNNGTETDEMEYIRILDRIFEISFATDGKAKCEIMLGNTNKEGQDKGCKALAHAFGVTFEPETLDFNIIKPKEVPKKKGGFLFQIFWDRLQTSQSSQQFQWPEVGQQPMWDEEKKGPPKANELIQGIQNKCQLTKSPDQFLLLERLDTISPHDQSKNLSTVAVVAPDLKSGFYVGNYGEMYSSFRHEILYISHRFVDTSNSKSMEEVFGSRTPPMNPFGTEDSSGFLLIGKKVTGDLHVPAGEITWCVDITKLNSTTNAPVTIKDKDSNKHNVIKSWNGMGTLSYYLFQGASWENGWLLELEKHKFAFCWKRQQDVTILYEAPFQL